jgi:endonuclease YncB( thermonuclease family)
MVGQCLIGDADVGLAMVNTGLAEAMLRYLPSSHPISLVEYGEAENRARGNGLGSGPLRSQVRISIAAPSPQRCLNP